MSLELIGAIVGMVVLALSTAGFAKAWDGKGKLVLDLGDSLGQTIIAPDFPEPPVAVVPPLVAEGDVQVEPETVLEQPLEAVQQVGMMPVGQDPHGTRPQKAHGHMVRGGIPASATRWNWRSIVACWHEV